MDAFDYALVGGGLHSGLIALALRAHQPDARIAVVERGAALGGNHTWCFHAGDVSPAAAAWIEPLIVARWPSYQVAFPGYTRRVESAYACVSSARLAREVARALGASGSVVHTSAVATEITARTVAVERGDGVRLTLHARAVIDARGPERARRRAGGWQKFVGRELVLEHPHDLDGPMLMDARVAQRDGFRFFYVLPLAPDRALVEDTYFSDSPELTVDVLRAEIARYVASRGWTVARVAREEVGALPMPFDAAAPSLARPLVAGYAGGWFHPATAYSFPVAARLAEHVATRPADQLHDEALAALARAHVRQAAFACRLNRMAFRWFRPEQRHHVFERFYRLPPPVIERFYALALTPGDRRRVLFGWPPRGISLRAVFGGAA